MKKRFAITALALALTAGSAMTSFAAGFTGTGKGVKYQWGDGSYCTNNWVQYRNHWFYFGDDQLMRTGWIQRDGTWYLSLIHISKIDGNPAVVGVCDARFIMSSMGHVVGEKITEAVERATKEKLPVILFACSGAVSYTHLDVYKRQGEYCALAAAGVMSEEDAITTVRQRGIFMQEEVPAGEGAMAAILALDAAVIEEEMCIRDSTGC